MEPRIMLECDKCKSIVKLETGDSNGQCQKCQKKIYVV